MSLAVEGKQFLEEHKKIEKDIANLLKVAIEQCPFINEQDSLTLEQWEDSDNEEVNRIIAAVCTRRGICQSYRFELGAMIDKQSGRMKKLKERAKTSPADELLDAGLDLLEKAYTTFNKEMYSAVDWLKARRYDCGDYLVDVLENQTWQMTWAAENWENLLQLVQ